MAERMVMPCVPLRGLSVFPHTILHFDRQGKIRQSVGSRDDSR